jgi:2-hydroxychromene-2-carboxylate isomerase
MPLSFDLYWSFRSPYSYLATGRIARLVDEFDVDCVVRPVYPIAIRTPEFFDKVNPLWPPYLFRDTVRISQMEGIPYAWPRPDPVVQDIAKRTIPKEQPYIHRLTRLGVAACEAGRGLPFIEGVSRLIWSGEVEGWHQGDHLARASERAGLDLAELDARIEADPEHFEAVIAKNQDDHRAAGHWGVPTMVFEGEPFFGQDRISHLVWRLEQHGLKPRD